MVSLFPLSSFPAAGGPGIYCRTRRCCILFPPLLHPRSTQITAATEWEHGTPAGGSILAASHLAGIQSRWIRCGFAFHGQRQKHRGQQQAQQRQQRHRFHHIPHLSPLVMDFRTRHTPCACERGPARIFKKSNSDARIGKDLVYIRKGRSDQQIKQSGNELYQCGRIISDWTGKRPIYPQPDNLWERTTPASGDGDRSRFQARQEFPGPAHNYTVLRTGATQGIHHLEPFDILKIAGEVEQ